MRALLALLVGLSLMAGLAWHLGWRLPDAWNPWAALDVRQPPNLLTAYKLSRLRMTRRCAAKRWQPVACVTGPRPTAQLRPTAR